jgi:transposase InsO family protein
VTFHFIDITYIPTGEGWLYLAAVEDLYSRRVVGWSMAEHLESRLVVDALELAVERRLPGEGLLAHSDRGSQYASDHYQRLLAHHGIMSSMSRRADCLATRVWRRQVTRPSCIGASAASAARWTGWVDGTNAALGLVC